MFVLVFIQDKIVIISSVVVSIDLIAPVTIGLILLSVIVLVLLVAIIDCGPRGAWGSQELRKLFGNTVSSEINRE